MPYASTSRWVVLHLCFLLCFLATGLYAAPAQELAPWQVHGKLLGKASGPSDFEKSEDVSGIACDRHSGFPRLCLVADDETQGTQIVVLKDGELIAGDFIKLTEAQHAGKPLELDAEGVAFESGIFYVIGSHGRPRHNDDTKTEEKSNAKAKATRQIFSITIPASAVDMHTGKLLAQAEIQASAALAGLLQSQPEISPSYDRALEDNGLTIEGIAVRNNNLFIGMRGPVIGTSAAVLSVALSAVFDRQPARSELHKLALGKDALGKSRGVRDLARHADGFLVLAGPVNDPPAEKEIQSGDYSIYFWDGRNVLNKLADLKPYGKKAKPEALLPLDGDTERVRVLLMFDGPKEGSPTPLEIKFK